jgi:Flp pilus assembly protein TadG
MIASTECGPKDDRPMLGNLLNASMMDEDGATAMKYALIAILLVLAVYQG